MATERLRPKHTTELLARFSRDQSIQPPGADPERAPRPIALRTSTRRAVAALAGGDEGLAARATAVR